MCAGQTDSQEELHKDNLNYSHENAQHSYQVIFMMQTTEAVERVSNCPEIGPTEMLLL